MKNYFQKLKCKNILVEGDSSEERVGSFLTSEGAQVFFFSLGCVTHLRVSVLI